MGHWYEADLPDPGTHPVSLGEKLGNGKVKGEAPRLPSEGSLEPVASGCPGQGRFEW